MSNEKKIVCLACGWDIRYTEDRPPEYHEDCWAALEAARERPRRQEARRLLLDHGDDLPAAWRAPLRAVATGSEEPGTAHAVLSAVRDHLAREAADV